MTGGDAVAANVEQAEAWDGDEGAHWVEHQHRYETMTGAFTRPLFAAAAIGETDRVLDVGCGCGETTRIAARHAARGRAVGLDLSGAMLQRAREDAAAERVTNVWFEQGDAQVYPFSPGAFDVAVSRFGVMFFGDPVAAFANIGAGLVPAGRLAVLCWQDLAHNDWVTVPAAGALNHVALPDLGGPEAPGPFSLADPDRITDVLARAGFAEISITAVQGQLRLGDDADDAVEFLRGTGIARTLLHDVDATTTAQVLDAIRAALRPHEQPGGLSLGGAAWLVTAHRA